MSASQHEHIGAWPSANKKMASTSHSSKPASTRAQLRSTESELSREIREKGPKGYAGYTSWRVSWSWPGYGSLFCDVSGANVDAAVTVTFPSWKPPADASPELVEKWARFVAALAVHEQGHVDNVYASLPRIREAIQSADCLSAEDAAQQIIAEMNQYDLDYDAETGYGRTQGAVFP